MALEAIILYTGPMKTKLDTLKEHATKGEWDKAISIAAKFPRLDGIRAAVLDAHTAYTNPRFTEQVGKSVDDCIRLGRSAIIRHYGIE